VAQAASRSRAPPLLWPTDAVIVAASIAIYGFVGTYGRPGNAVAPSATVSRCFVRFYRRGRRKSIIGGATLSSIRPTGIAFTPRHCWNSVLTQASEGQSRQFDRRRIR